MSVELPPIRLVVFDMAGTTVRDRDEVLACFQQAARETGLGEVGRDRLNPLMGWAKRRAFEILWREHWGAGDGGQVDLAALADRVDGSYARFQTILDDYYRTQPVEPTDGCLETFAVLKARGIAIGLNTGFYREVTDIILNRLGWDRGLDDRWVGSAQAAIQVSVTPSEIYNNEGRPAPYLIQKAAYLLGVRDPKAIVAVGDTPSDLAAAYNAGCRAAFAVVNGTHDRETLAAHPHDGLLDSLRSLPEAIERLQAVPETAPA